MNEQQKSVEAGLFNDTSAYRDILNRPRHRSKAHLEMPPTDRAAQFAPFAALTGYQELIKQRAQLAAHKHYPTAAQMAVITAQLHRVEAQMGRPVRVNYFNETAGFYQTTTANLVKVDWDCGDLRLSGPLTIAIANIRRLVLTETDAQVHDNQ